MNVAWFAPWAIGGVMFAIASGLLLHIIPGRILIVISECSQFITYIILALLPGNPNYWATFMPAMLCEAGCVNILFTVSNVFLTTSLPRKRQGLAGALIYVTMYLGSAFFLAITNVAMVDFKRQGLDVKTQYRNLFWIGVGLSGLAMAIGATVGVPKAKAASADPDERQPKNIDDSHFTNKNVFKSSAKHENVDGEGIVLQEGANLAVPRLSIGAHSEADTVVGSGSDDDAARNEGTNTNFDPAFQRGAC